MHDVRFAKCKTMMDEESKMDYRPLMLENCGRFVVADMLNESINSHEQEPMLKSTVVDCGWGRLIFGQTFNSLAEIAGTLQSEPLGQRDIALCVRDPHGVLAVAPRTLFLDPSYSYRLDLRILGERNVPVPSAPIIRPVMGRDEAAINQLYQACDMVPVRKGFCAGLHDDPEVTVFVAQGSESQSSIIGVAMGIDHRAAFNDPNNGSSLWALAVAPQTHSSSVRIALVTALGRHFKDAGRSFMDFCVSRDDPEAIALCKDLGFLRTPIRAIRRKQPKTAAIV